MVGLEGQPIVVLTKIGWMAVSRRSSNEATNLLFSKSSLHDHIDLCSLDCLDCLRN